MWFDPTAKELRTDKPYDIKGLKRLWSIFENGEISYSGLTVNVTSLTYIENFSPWLGCKAQVKGGSNIMTFKAASCANLNTVDFNLSTARFAPKMVGGTTSASTCDLSYCDSLTYIDMSNMGGTGTAYFKGAYLKGCTHIEELDMSDNKMDLSNIRDTLKVLYDGAIANNIKNGSCDFSGNPGAASAELDATCTLYYNTLKNTTYQWNCWF